MKDERPGEKAEPNWETFKTKHQSSYFPSADARRLLDLHPKRQFVTEYGELEWKPVGFDHCSNDLCKVVTALLTVRNNLFHGGKHGDVDVDDKARNLELLACGKAVLDQLAKIACFSDDYERYY